MMTVEVIQVGQEFEQHVAMGVKLSFIPLFEGIIKRLFFN